MDYIIGKKVTLNENTLLNQFLKPFNDQVKKGMFSNERKIIVHKEFLKNKKLLNITEWTIIKATNRGKFCLWKLVLENGNNIIKVDSSGINEKLPECTTYIVLKMKKFQ